MVYYRQIGLGDTQGERRRDREIASLLRCPANVLADGAASSLADRGHALRSLFPPPAALPSLPGVSTSPTLALTATPLGSLGIVLAYRIVPLCHCEERSDVAIRPQKTPSRFHLLETQICIFLYTQCDKG